MTKTARFLLLFLILIIAVAVLCLSVIQRVDAPVPSQSPAASDDASASAPASAPPQDTPVPDAVPAPEETALPEETPEPESTPEPTEAPVSETPPPVETPVPTPESVNVSGSFTSDTGTALNLLVEWTAYTDESGRVMLRMNAAATSYSIFAAALHRGLTLSINGKTAAAADCPEISYDGKEMITTPMAEFLVEAPASGSEISVRWNYRGTYSGKEIDQVIASGVIEY